MHFPDSGQVLRFAQKWSVELMFYDKFKLLCDQKGVSCNKAATDMGLSNSTPTKWKKTGATPDGATLAKISAYFGVSVGKLLTNESTGAIEFTVSTKEMQDYLQSKKKAPALTEKDERDVAKSVEEIMNDLSGSGELMFDGVPMSAEAKAAMASAMRVGLEEAKRLNKETYTPKKYRKE